MIAALVSFLVISCSDDEDPEEVHEEEVITTLNVSFTEQDGNGTFTLQSQDLDGDGPNEPEISSTGSLSANTTYNGVIELLNETESPAEDITEEVEEEDEDHQFFYSTSGAISSTSYSDEDANGNPVGIAFSLSTGDAGSGTLTITLKHEPTKPNDGLASAGGETDIAVTFNVTVE